MASNEMMIKINVESSEIVLRALTIVKKMADAPISFEDEDLPKEIKDLVSQSKDFVAFMQGKTLAFQL